MAISPQVLIIGHDLPGLMAAYYLHTQGKRVAILDDPHLHQEVQISENLMSSSSRDPLESSRSQLSTFSYPLALPGILPSFLSLLENLTPSTSTAFSRHFSVEVATLQGKPFRFRPLPFPIPSPWLLEFLRFGKIPLGSRWRFANYLEKIWEGRLALPPNLDSISADSWLSSCEQCPTARHILWNPLCHFLLGHHPTHISAQAFTQALLNSYLTSPGHTTISWFLQDVDRMLTTPLRQELGKMGIPILNHLQVDSLVVNSSRVTGIRDTHGKLLQADWYLLNLRPHNLLSLIPERQLAKYSYFYNLQNLSDTSTLTIQLQVPMPHTRPRVILTQGDFDWVILSKGPTDAPAMTQVTMVARGHPELMSYSNLKLLDLALHHLQQFFPQLRIPSTQHDNLSYRLIREPTGLFLTKPGSLVWRPAPLGPISNLLLMGDWTDVSAPPGIQGAVISANLCAQQVLAQ
ncbi:MAG: FAD-dependent oxidoreductase [Nitrospirae bacterium]|nr:FAD-dependent oxidoreductase [Nitrospirota bacterium]